MPGVCEEICTFGWFELLKRIGRGRRERVEGSRRDHSHERVELAKAFSIGLKAAA